MVLRPQLFLKWVRRMVVYSRKQVAHAMRRYVGAPIPEKDPRLFLEEARKRPGMTILPKVVELPTHSFGVRVRSATLEILILQLAHIGDFVLSLRAMKKLRRGFPAARITLVCASWNVDWARRTELFDEIVEFNFFPSLNVNWRGVEKSIFERFEQLQLGVYDIAIDLRHDPDTRPCLYRVRATTRAGYYALLEGFPPLDLMLPSVELIALSNGQTFSLHAEMRLELLADVVVNALAEPADSHPASLLLPHQARTHFRPYVVFAVGAGDPIRRWPTANYVELAQKLIAEYELDVLVVGGANEGKIVEEICEQAPARTFARIDLPLDDLAASLAQAVLVVGLGSGVSHLAAALGTPTLVLLSGVSPLDVWRSVGPRVINLNAPMPCSPCGLRHETECPFGVTCLRSITPNDALQRIRALMPKSVFTG